ncbi:RNA polymerase sigma factor [Mesobacillus zeae]|uniref:RNA polymerase sigma factor n=1 Tax=Mesobacillus zeae TaxID=1917180 RepID=A0A398BLR2_9BACI|nr:sigma-70 family RNA polymerase sigma factor [Mesobacillus zeae]RID88293.1 sigma-70 family RNA polymerase sigma factor [Mesobacillus zeae]
MVEVDFDEMYIAHSKRLHYLAFSVTRDVHLAEDVVQETFVKAFKKMDTIESTEKVGAWLSAIATRTAIDFLRAEKRKHWMPADQLIMEQVLYYPESGLTPEEEVDIRLFKEELNRSVFTLSEEYREVLILRLQYGLQEKEIASVLDLKSATVKSRLHRARKQLKQTIAEKHPA